MSDHSQLSYWLENYGPYKPLPALEGDLEVDVAIIGAGYTGLSTAFNLCQDQPGLEVVVLEAEIVGFGASGRNGGFSMTLFGLEPAVTKAIFGHQRTIEAHRYMERAVDYVDRLIKNHDLESDYWYPGFLRAATTTGYVKRIHHDLEILTSMGITGLEWLEAQEIRAEVNSPRFLGGWWEPRCGLLDPAKQARELKRIAQASGAQIFENSPVTEIERDGRFTLSTPRGKVQADKIAFATNAYSHLFPQLKSKQVPAFTHMVLTDPLDDQHFAEIGWKNRQGIEDARNLVHYFRLTIDNRLAMGGSDVSIAYGLDMDRDLNQRIFRDLERDITWLFPNLKGIKVTHRWGGPLSVPVDLAPAIGFIGDQRAVYSLGCVGHGVSMAHLNGRTLADLILERDTDLTEVWFVNRRMIPWPPEPLRLLLSHAIRGYLRIEDAIYERGLAVDQ
ncbi:MAG: FAD-dependent oxidoreductase [Chloroflexota bacterium]|nr:MAG: FAD-dependent oxidoreductase [Chloroflexota bacterium]